MVADRGAWLFREMRQPPASSQKEKQMEKDRCRDTLIAGGMERSSRGSQAQDTHTVPLRREFADKYWLF